MFWHKKDSGFTFLEIVVSLLVLTVGTLSTLQIINVAMDANNRSIRQTIASNLASALMNEIMTKNFEEPGTNNLNTLDDEGEDRFNVPIFDDIDDYDSTDNTDGIFDSPPRTIGNTVLANYPGFSRSVRVEFVRYEDTAIDPDTDPDTWVVQGAYEPKKRVTVIVDSGPTVHYVLDTGIVSDPTP